MSQAPPEPSTALATRLADIRERIERAFEGRRALHPDAAPPRLIGVTKRHPLAAIVAAHGAGLRDFGENYAQEFRDKTVELEGQATSFEDLSWHFIGQLQRNKVKYVVGRALIHTVDRLALVEALAARASSQQVTQSILVEVNTGESQKGGVAPGELGALLDAIARHPSLRCEGLMAMAPLASPPQVRGAFERVADLRREHAQKPRSNVNLAELSMGMSGDFELAIEAGATLVRVGTAIFGPRPGA